MLKADGKIYFEIGFQQGALQELLSAAYPQKQLKLKRFIWQRSPRDSRVTKVLRRHFSRRSDLQWKQKINQTRNSPSSSHSSRRASGFPTETVYGLGADALNEAAVKKFTK